MKPIPHDDKIARKQRPSVIGHNNRPIPCPRRFGGGGGGQADGTPMIPLVISK